MYNYRYICNRLWNAADCTPNVFYHQVGTGTLEEDPTGHQLSSKRQVGADILEGYPVHAGTLVVDRHLRALRQVGAEVKECPIVARHVA